jgi:ribonucleoside-diphosphate reductase alpha chain
MMRFPFDSPEARTLNKDIFETIYFAAMTESVAMAEKEGAYETFKGSPLSEGQFQFDLWGVKPSARWDWETLRQKVVKVGARNSLLVAPMPTASTSQILGNNECFEPYTSNIYTRRTLSGEHIIVNKHLLKDLVALGLWNEEMRQAIMASNGSIMGFEDIPMEIRALYKTAYEISQKVIIDQAADRGAFICQSQSLNIFMENPSFAKLSSMHFYAWQRGLKTGMYYLRSKAAVDPIKFTLSEKHQRVQATTTGLSHVEMVAPEASFFQTKPVEMSFSAKPKMAYETAATDVLVEEKTATMFSDEPIPMGKICSMDDPTCEACSA